MSEPSPATQGPVTEAAAAQAPAAGSSETQALQQAMMQLLTSVARLSVARGLPYVQVEELLKRAFVDAASAAHPGLPEHRKVSRISTSTGINRREVTRLTAPAKRDGGRPPARSLANELYAHWRTHPSWRDGDGQPRVLPRLGPAPSFEALAQEITRDVHARSLLDELCRLGLARLDDAADTVALQGDAFVPRGDRVRMLGFLGENVGDHLRAAVDNVLANDRPPHLEQALFAEGLTAASLEALRPLLREQWARLRQAVVPALEAEVAAGAAAADARGRVRLGLYAYQEMPVPEGGLGTPAPTRVRTRRAAPGRGTAAGKVNKR
jgi:Family of unknown function (DUF6502)